MQLNFLFLWRSSESQIKKKWFTQGMAAEMLLFISIIFLIRHIIYFQAPSIKKSTSKLKITNIDYFQTRCSLIILLICSSILFSENVFAAAKPNVLLSTDQQYSSLITQLRYIEDPTYIFNINEIRTRSDTGWLATDDNNLPNFGHTGSRYWLNLRITPATSEVQFNDYLLEINNPSLDLVNIYYYQDEQLIYNKTVGRLFAFHERVIDHRHFLFPINFSNAKPIDIYIAVDSISTLKIPLNIWEKSAFYSFDQGITFISGINYGLLFVMTLFNIFIFFITRDRAFLTVALLTFVFSFHRAIMHGYAFQYLWPEQAYFNQYAIHIFRPLSFFVSILFAVEFLNLDKSRFFYKIFAGFAYISLLVISFIVIAVFSEIAPDLSIFFINFTWQQTVLTTSLGIYCIYTGFYLWIRESHKSASFFTIAWFFPIILFPLVTFYQLPDTFGFVRGEVWLATIITSTSILLFSFSVSVRINEMKNQLATVNSDLLISKNNIDNLIDRAPIMLLITDLNLVIQDVNALLLERLGFEKNELLGQSLISITDQLPQDWINKNLSENNNTQLESVFLPKQEKTIPVLVSVSQLFDIKSRKIRNVIAAQDLSELKKVEQESNELMRHLNQAQRLKIIGTFTSGIAHDMNNILTPILGYSEMLLDDFDEDSIHYQHLLELLKAGERGSDLVQQLLNFSRVNDEEEKSGVLIEQNIEDSLQDSINFIKVLIPTNIEISHQIDGPCPSVKLIRNSFHQILVNFCTNAAHAITKTEGHINIRLFTLTVADNHPIIKIPGEYLGCSVSDNGIGIATEQLERIFEPFYSTKSRKQGTGLGLSIVYGLVKKNKGFISVESVLNKGTTFHFYFPAAMTIADENEEKIEQKSSRSIKAGFGRILYVDDEAAITLLMEKRLCDLGYQVITFNNSPKALFEIEKKPDYFDLIISDFAMPELNGQGLAAKIRSFNQQVPIILVTGNIELLDIEYLQKLNVNTYLPKPVDMSELNQAISNALNE